MHDEQLNAALDRLVPRFDRTLTVSFLPDHPTLARYQHHGSRQLMFHNRFRDHRIQLRQSRSRYGEIRRSSTGQLTRKGRESQREKQRYREQYA